MSITELHAPLLSPEDYLDGEDGAPQKHEYLNGVVYAMAGGTTVHSLLATNTIVALGTQLRGKRCRPFNSDALVRVRRGEDLRFYYPDVSVVCDPNPLLEHYNDRPVAIFEVLSPSTARIDRGEKREAYCCIPTLRVYALIESETMAVTVWRRADERWATEYFASTDAVISLDEIECELALAEIYEGSELQPAS